jgi:hypothetical protein
MAGVVGLIIFFIILAARRSRGEPIELSLAVRLRFLKGVELGVLLLVFGGVDLIGKALLVPAFILLFTPSFVLRQVVVPLGLPRVAYWTARWLGPIKVMKESSAGAAVYGALALARRPSSLKTLDWLELKVNLARSVRGAGVVAAGLLAALRGDRDRARGLFLIADAMQRKHIPRCVRVVARDWLVADAARIGNWTEVARLGRRGKGSLRWSYALARMAERLAGDPRGCWNWQLWLWWIIAPRRIATFACCAARSPCRALKSRRPTALRLPIACRMPSRDWLTSWKTDSSVIASRWPALWQESMPRSISPSHALACRSDYRCSARRMTLRRSRPPCKRG